MSQPLPVEPDLDFIRDLERRGGESLKKCYQCATCSVVCELSPHENPFPRKEMLWSQWGLKDRLMGDPDVWLCFNCNDCSIQCPRGAKPGEVLGAVRASVIERYALPRFMGKAMASVKGLPVLLLFAALVVLALVWWTGERKGLENWGLNAPLPERAEGGGFVGGYFGNFLEHGPVEMIFIGGNILVFLLMAVSLSRFWKDMKKAYRPMGPVKEISFVSALIATILEIIPHGDFKSCTAAKSRYLGHLLVFYGFFGAMATAGLAVLDMVILGHQPPIPFFHPIKILGNASFLALMIGSLMILAKRLWGEDQVGRSRYFDWVFLVSLFLVALTGGLVQLGRQLAMEQPAMAYIFYFVHMTAVFFLLWYMPYSKFAHMFYRTLGLTFAKSMGRSRKR